MPNINCVQFFFLFAKHMSHRFHLVSEFLSSGWNLASSTKPQKVNQPHIDSQNTWLLFIWIFNSEYLKCGTENIWIRLFLCVSDLNCVFGNSPYSMVAGLLLTDIQVSDYYLLFFIKSHHTRAWLSSKWNQFYLWTFKETFNGEWAKPFHSFDWSTRRNQMILVAPVRHKSQNSTMNVSILFIQQWELAAAFIGELQFFRQTDKQSLFW